MKNKYNPGDLLGPYKIKLLQITKITDYGHRYGLFECPQCKKSFEAKLYHVTAGSTKTCKECRSMNKKGNKNHNFKNLIGQRFGKLTVTKYLGNKQVGQEHNGKILTRSLWECTCDCGNIIQKTTNELTRGNTSSCSNCNLKSRGEYKIKSILNTLEIQYECQKRFPNCKDIYTLPFDFYLPKYNCCIEYDGTSHYTYNEYGSWNTKENLEKTKRHDSIKNDYCQKNNIKLIRIPYTEYDNLDNNYFLELLKYSIY